MIHSTKKLDEDALVWESHSDRTSAQEASLAPAQKVAPALSTDVHSALTRAVSLHGEPTASLPDQPPLSSDAPATVAGHIILEELGRGGMGIVYKALQVKLKRKVALKMVLADSRIGPHELARFRTEAEAVACLQHPNIVQIYEVGEDAGRPYFALEFADGGSLADKLKAGPLPPVEAAELLAILAEAMHFAHSRGIIHRDLKPGNVLLMADGTPKITDFGLAKQQGKNQDQTRTGAVLGTPAYMAPEQARGQFKSLGPAADIYALGTILYEALAGRPPFVGETPIETLRQVSMDDPVPLSRLLPRNPRDLETICLKCLEKEPHRRYQTAQDLADDLRRFLAHEPIQARRVRSWERGLKWVRRRPLIATLLAVTVLALAGLGAGTLVYAQSERQRERTARAEVDQLLVRAREAMTNKAWANAKELLHSANARISSERALDDLHEGVDTYLREVEGRLASLAAYQTFVRQSNDTFFQATLNSGEGSRDRLSATRDQAQATLAQVGVSVPQKVEWTPILSWSPGEREEIRQGCLKLLLVLADAVAGPLPQQTALERRQQAQQGLLVLDSVPFMGLETPAFHLRRARYLAQAGSDALAKAERELAAAHPPASVLDFYLLGEDHYKNGNPTEALGMFQKALELQPNHFWACYFLSLCYLRLGEPALARDNLRSCIEQQPAIVWLYLMRGFARGQLLEYQDAEADFQHALEMHPSVDALYVLYNNRGVMLIGQKKFQGAVDDLKKAIVLKPNQYQAYVTLSQACAQQNQPEEAIRHMSKAIEVAEKLVQAGDLETATLALLHRNRCRLYLARQAPDKALAEIERVVALEPAESPARAKATAQRGRLLQSTRHYEEAVKAYDEALGILPGHAETHRWRGEALFQLKRYAEAITAFTQYLQNGGKAAPKVFEARAVAKVRLGNPEAAIDDLTRALDCDPNDIAMLTFRGQAYLTLEANQLALHDFETAIQLNRQSAAAYNGRGLARARLGQDAAAVADAEKAVELGPLTPQLLYNGARVFAQAVTRMDADASRQNRPPPRNRLAYQDRALELIEQALRLTPEAERKSFWQEIIHADKALGPVRRTAEFARLERQYSIPRAKPPLAGGPDTRAAAPEHR